jgi:hypothetical protein
MRVNTPNRLIEILRALPEGELESLVARLGIRIDPAKRLDTASQVARALVALPDLRDPTRLPHASVELLHRVAEAKGTLLVPSIPPALEPLIARGMLFARGQRGAIELVLPIAYLVQLKTWEGEDPRSARALLAQGSFEATSAIASHYLGRPATPPISLSLEPAWEVLSDLPTLAAEIDKLAPSERRVLEKVEQEGGEVDTEELLELEREPMRLRTATGVTPSRRGVGSALERRGFLVPVHPNRHVVPTEVSLVIGAARRADRAKRREQVLTFVLGGDHAPRRAKFALDPAPLALGMALATRETTNADVRPGIGTPKSLTQKFAARFGRPPEHVALIAAVSRAIGLWDVSALSPGSPPGSLAMSELLVVLFSAWRKGGAWDEARVDAEVLRLGDTSRDPSPVGVVREMVLEALVALGEGWIPWTALAGYFRTDDRMAGLERLFRRWADRTGAQAVSPLEVARRIVHESLPSLGVIDLGEDDDLLAPPAADEADAPYARVAIKLSARGRSMLNGKPLSVEPSHSKFLDAHVLRLGTAARIASVLAIAPLVEVSRCADTVDLIVAPQTLARALSAGLEADSLKQRIEAIAPLPESLSRTLAQASVVLGRATFSPASGFLWVEDASVRELLRTRRATGELFVDPSPSGGLLLALGVDLERVVRRCRTVGVEIVIDGEVVRARTLPPPAVSPTPPPARRSTPTPMASSVTKRSRSASQAIVPIATGKVEGNED